VALGIARTAGLKRESGDIIAIDKKSFVPVGTKKDELDILSQFDDLLAKSKSTPDTIKVVELPALDEFKVEPATAEPDVAALLAQAVHLYGQGQLTAALELLGRVLVLAPDNTDALWLKVGCLVRIGGSEVEALRILMELRAVDPDPQRQALRGQLLKVIREGLVPKTVLTVMLMLTSGQTDKAITLTGKLSRLDPGCATYHSLSAGALATDERFDDALAAADDGLREARDDDCEQLEDLRMTILRRMAADKMAGARDLFLRGKDTRALAALGRLRPTLGEAPLFRSFDGYMKRLVGAGGGLAAGRRSDSPDVVPPGTPNEADAVFFFLVGDLIAKGKTHFEAGETALAVEVLRKAVGYCPGFPYANFMLAVALYNGAAQRIQSVGPSEAEAALADIRAARDAAKIGLNDPDMGGSAKALHDAIEETLGDMQSGANDASLINPIVEEYERTMKKVGDGIGSSAQLREVDGGLKQIERDLQAVGGKLATEEGRRAVAQLITQVREQLKQIKDVSGSVETGDELGSLIALFNSTVARLQQDHISSLSERDTYVRLFEVMRTRVETLRGKAKRTPAEKTVKELLNAIKGIEKQLGKL